MPRFTFKCDQCACVDEDVEMDPQDYASKMECVCMFHPDCQGTMHRIWDVPPSIAHVKGAGGSPGRT